MRAAGLLLLRFVLALCILGVIYTPEGLVAMVADILTLWNGHPLPGPPAVYGPFR